VNDLHGYFVVTAFDSDNRSILLSYLISAPPGGSHPSARSKGKGSPYSINERRVPELIPVLGGQPAGDVNHKPDGRLPLLSASGLQLPPQPLRGLLPILLLGEQRHNGCDCYPTVCLRLLPDSVATAI